MVVLLLGFVGRDRALRCALKKNSLRAGAAACLAFFIAFRRFIAGARAAAFFIAFMVFMAFGMVMIGKGGDLLNV